VPEQPEPQSPAPPRIAAIVVSRNRVQLLRRCLESLEGSEARETLDVVVVDNGSSDGCAHLDEEFPNARFIRLPKNFGLTKALNIGMRAVETEYVLLLHEDTELEPGVVRLLAETLDSRSDAAAACPLLVDGEGRPAPQLGCLPPDDSYRPASPAGEPAVVDYPRGAAIMMHLFFLRAMRRIDERYGQFGSDADLAMQVRRGARKILLVPAARVRHQGREETDGLRRADAAIGRAVWIGKYQGFVSGIAARIGAVLSALFGLRLGEFGHVASGQKIDGTQG
jgi:N-acetylglucosaminyl-diphospho-decaprenol L-rhamnosyltransferase